MYQLFAIIGLGLALPVSAANYTFPVDVEGFFLRAWLPEQDSNLRPND